LNRAAIVGSIFILVNVATPYLVGGYSNVYFFKQTGKIALLVSKGITEALITALISSARPHGSGTIFLMVFLSLPSRTMSSQFFNIGTSSAATSIFRLAKKDSTRKEVLVARMGFLFGILVTILLGFKLESEFVARGPRSFRFMASAFLARSRGRFSGNADSRGSHSPGSFPASPWNLHVLLRTQKKRRPRRVQGVEREGRVIRAR
jgi:SSS family solute:Na+ symporter